MNKLILKLVTALALTTIAANAQMSTQTALQYFKDNDIRAGWNLGNTLEAVNSARTLAVESEWISGSPPATQELFDSVRVVGFDLARIPVTWIGHFGAAPDYKISEERLARVDEVVNYAKNAGFKAIIINIHHDGNYTEPNRGTWGFVDMAGAIKDPTLKTQIENQLTVMWTQIADYFKDHGQYLIFETLNEVHSGHWGHGSNQAFIDEEAILFDWNQAALNAIRATGGNNATRYVAVPGLGSTEPQTVISANNRGKLLPNDGVNGTDRLIVSVHYYEPSQYTVADAENREYPLIHDWGTPVERSTLTSRMSSLKTNFLDKGIAAYIGEWGAPTQVRRNMSEETKNTHVDYIGSVATAARQNGIVPIYWDDGGNFRVLERTSGGGRVIGKPLPGLATDVLNAMMLALNGAIVVDPDIDPDKQERIPLDLFSIATAHKITDADTPDSDGKIGASTLEVTEAGGVMTMNYVLAKNTYEWNPYVAAYYSIDEGSMGACTYGISYAYKGGAHALRAEQSNTGEGSGWDIHISGRKSAADDWTTVDLAWYDFEQEGWGVEVAQDRTLVNGLTWHISGPDGTSGTLEVKDVYCLQAGSSSVSIPQRRSVPSVRANAISHTPVYYNLKGEPLGTTKPTTSGVYIVKNIKTGQIQMVFVK